MSDPFSVFRHHGGNLSAAVAATGRPRAEWLDLSTGINPRPYPVPPIPADAWTRLPEAAEDAALVEAARAAYGVAKDAAVVPAPGTQALIQWLPLLRPRGRVGIVGPTYGEHATAWARAGHAVEDLSDPPAPDDAGAPDVVVVVNPNNPDGRRHDSDALLALAEGQARRGGWLVVDEAFADVAPEVSLCGRAGGPGLVILRSPGKFYGLAGLRLGFAVTAEDVAAALAANLGPWAVAGPALAVGAAALGDPAWQDATRAWLAERRRALDGVLAAAGLTIAGGTDLFRLIETSDAAARFERLARAGILARPFAYAPRWLRLGLPADDAGLARLAEAMV
ncbi:threonine-phosphate decarboxylase CobD [Caenispirillum salinarum]|uniref:threonine-phosphate decarboxylase CobD n=1 Tax=Caenispirillum salinarum TaxID=859058 RepID=UPI00384C289D